MERSSWEHFPFIVTQYCVKPKVLGQGRTNLSCSLQVMFYGAIIAFGFGVLCENSQVTEYEMVVVNNAWQLKYLTRGAGVSIAPWRGVILGSRMDIGKNLPSILHRDLQ